MSRLMAVVLAGVWLAAPWVAQGQTPEEAPSWCVSVWYPSSEMPTGFDSITNNLDVIDEVNPFWYSPLPDGGLTSDPQAEDADQLRLWREAGLHVLPTIVSFGLSAMIEDPQVRQEHIATIVALVERMDYDGIDIDYESFARRTRDDFSTFIEDLAAALHAHGRLLSLAVHAKTTDEGTWEGAAAQDWSRLAPAVDIFRIMTYDYHNDASDAGPIGPPEWSRAVLEYAASVVPLSQVRLGLHFYGYSWQRRPTVSTVTWETVQRWVEAFDLTVERDPSDMEARIELQVRGLPRQTVYVADAVGLAYKLDLILNAFPELGGVAIWGLGGEDPANWEVLRQHRTGACTSFDP